MPIKVPSHTEIDNIVAKMEDRMKRVLTRRLMYVGEMCVNKARNLPLPSRSIYWDSSTGERQRHIPRHVPNYIDWTANLRSSIGYVVVMDGQIVGMSDFSKVKGLDSDGGEGSKKGKEYARSLASRFPQGAALIVVAGMDYASYVQRKGYDVLVSAEQLANDMLGQLNAKITHLQ